MSQGFKTEVQAPAQPGQTMRVLNFLATGGIRTSVVYEGCEAVTLRAGKTIPKTTFWMVALNKPQARRSGSDGWC